MQKVFFSGSLLALAAFLSVPSLHAQAAASTDTVEQQQVRTLETTWANALVKKDQYGLDLVLAPTFVNISATGEVTTKNQQIARMFAGNYPLETYKETLTSIRVLGDSAIAQGTYSLVRKNGAQDVEEKGIFTHVYQRVRETWQCVNAQRTVVVEHAAPPAHQKAKKEGELPFHVPFVGHRKPKQQQQPDQPVTELAPDAGDTAASSSETTTTPAPAAAAPAGDSGTSTPQLENPK